MNGDSYRLVGLLRRAVYGRLAGYEDVNDADRLGRDPAMRWIVGGKGVEHGGASTSQMDRFETELLATDDNLTALADLPGIWIDRVHRKPPKIIVLDMDRSVSPIRGAQASNTLQSAINMIDEMARLVALVSARAAPPIPTPYTIARQ